MARQPNQVRPAPGGVRIRHWLTALMLIIVLPVIVPFVRGFFY